MHADNFNVPYLEATDSILFQISEVLKKFKTFDTCKVFLTDEHFLFCFLSLKIDGRMRIIYIHLLFITLNGETLSSIHNLNYLIILNSEILEIKFARRQIFFYLCLLISLPSWCKPLS